MNEPTPKKILFNKSIFLSLKAELIKKQEEVEEKKRLPQHKIENFKQNLKAKEKINKIEGKISFKDKLKAVDTDELEACRKAKLALEKKAELYEHLSDPTGNSQLADHFLVNFKEKKEHNTLAVNEQQEDQEETIPSEDESDWTEFTDFLGRTRKCLKSDLEYYKQRNEELKNVVSTPREEQKTRMQDAAPKVEKPFLVQKTNDYLQSLREKWEMKEQEMLAKDKDIHYQDVLFDEARMHGVGYFSFSTDETERQKQMEELNKQRQQTLHAQKQAEEARNKREELMAARVAAAKARQRIRAGLPPEDPEEKKKDFTTCLLKFLNEQKNAADSKAKEEERKKKEEEEKERQKLREAYIREWDLGKEGVDGTVKRFREMTQEEYVEQQRAKRIDEFAPKPNKETVSSRKSKYIFDSRGKKLDTNKPEKSWADVRRMETPPPPDIIDIEDPTKGLYFSTRSTEKSVKYPNFVQSQDSVLIQNNIEDEMIMKSNKDFVSSKKNNSTTSLLPLLISATSKSSKKTEKVIKYRNFIQSQEPVPIENELDNDNYTMSVSMGSTEERVSVGDHTEIEPPKTYDYYGPIPKYRKTEKPFNSDMNEAFAQGSKSLEHKDSSRPLPKTYDFTFD